MGYRILTPHDEIVAVAEAYYPLWKRHTDAGVELTPILAIRRTEFGLEALTKYMRLRLKPRMGFVEIEDWHDQPTPQASAWLADPTTFK